MTRKRSSTSIACFALLTLGCPGSGPNGMLDPNCERRAVYCDGDRIVFCTKGVATREIDCAESGRTCSSSMSQCVLADMPDPRCPNADPTAACDGDVRVSCYGGFATREEPCAAGCVKLEGSSHAMCLLPNAEQLCPPGSELQHEDRCSDNQHYYCYEGMALVFEDCALEGRICGPDHLGYTACHAPMDP